MVAITVRFDNSWRQKSVKPPIFLKCAKTQTSISKNIAGFESWFLFIYRLYNGYYNLLFITSVLIVEN